MKFWYKNSKLNNHNIILDKQNNNKCLNITVKKCYKFSFILIKCPEKHTIVANTVHTDYLFH